LIILDEVSDAETFRATLWSYRHIVTGTSDLYFEMSNRRRMKAEVAARQKTDGRLDPMLGPEG
jgi:hypothetical protein